ncbi:MAG: UDP-glucose 4-epimerase GalE [Gammaproteobacteria bacterium]|nr:MAG: UDP-glucose 4-epimerase GalE [Gammaproteobacteria bacterium]
MKVLVTGGAGYIGSHACVALLSAGHDIVVLDNYSNSSEVSPRRVREITGCDFPVIVADVNDRCALDNLLACNEFDAVMHFAGLKAVGESCVEPLNYYRNNVAGTITLLQAMQAAGIGTFIFSSSATVYGDPATTPITEDFPLHVTNPYGRSKLMIEDILRDLVTADQISEQPFWRMGLLRYFNPAGAHPSGLIGEDPKGLPNNLLPYITQVAVGKLSQLSVYGDDYPTPDGTGIRDYLHVMDLAEGHVCALERLKASEVSYGCHTWNLGTGKGYSVLEMIKAFEAVTGLQIPFQVVGRRPGDIAECWADASKAESELGWRARRSLEEMLTDSWRWQSDNPQGYDD